MVADTSAPVARPVVKEEESAPTPVAPTPVAPKPHTETAENRPSGETPGAGGPRPASLNVPPPAPTPTPTAPPPVAALAPKPAAVAASAASGLIYSAKPAAKIPPPSLPRVFTAKDAEQLARVCAVVEQATVSAGVSPEYARGVTASLRRLVGVNADLYPVAMYYFIVREAGLGHDKGAAASNLASAHSSGLILKFKNLPANERSL
jgi:hypothetical protein